MFPSAAIILLLWSSNWDHYITSYTFHLSLLTIVFVLYWSPVLIFLLFFKAPQHGVIKIIFWEFAKPLALLFSLFVFGRLLRGCSIVISIHLCWGWIFWETQLVFLLVFAYLFLASEKTCKCEQRKLWWIELSHSHKLD